jgi:hypothetical protein
VVRIDADHLALLRYRGAHQLRRPRAPHLHAEYQGDEALFELRTGNVIAGRLPRAAARLVREWMTRHREALMRNWDLASRGEPTFRIPGLDNEPD